MNYVEKYFDSNVKAKATRLSFGEHLCELGKSFNDVVALDADLAKSTQTQIFAKAFPERFFEMGIAEANMIGTAAGMALAGKIPFAASFACFLTGRFDQIRMSVAFTNAKVCLVGTHAGVGIGEDGHSQMGLEDLALMRSLPEMLVFQPADDWDTRQFMDYFVKSDQPAYMRLTRQGLPLLNKEKTDFELGRWSWIHKAAKADIALIGSGSMVAQAVKAADIIYQKTQKECHVINANWIAPYDKKLIYELSQDRKIANIVSLEDHYNIAGLGGLLAEELSQFSNSSRLHRIGVQDFGQSGSPEYNLQHYGFDPESLAENIMRNCV